MKIHRSASPEKYKLCDGRYDLRLAGFDHTITRNENVRMTRSAISVAVLNLLFSIIPFSDFSECEISKKCDMLLNEDL